MNFGHIINHECINVAPPPDPRCADPAFALANPDVCPVAPRLVIKPGVAVACALSGSLQFRAVFITSGIEEDVTSDTIFTTSDPNVAVIGAVTGNATGLNAGDVTITATYEGYQAFAELAVIVSESENCCEEVSVAIMVLVDVTYSMSRQFGGGYATRLAFARAAARSFILGVNEEKDVVGLMTFHKDTGTVVQEPTGDSAACAALVDGIVQTTNLTDFYDAVNAGITQLDAVVADRKVMLIISDGEDLSTTYLEGGNPLESINAFKDAGGIVMCLGARSCGRGYNLLSTLATGGMFINALSTTASESIAYLNGLRGYVCGGNCVSDGDFYAATPQVDYTAFREWSVVAGHVDLIGEGLMDHIPGEGLYVNLRSMAQAADDAALGSIETTEAISVTGGNEYRLIVDLAGNQLVAGTYVVRVQVLHKNSDGDDDLIELRRDISISDYTQAFKTYSYNFTATVGGTVYIRIEMLSLGSAAIPLTGCLLGRVRFENTTTAQVLLLDDFNTENMQYVVPRCGAGTIYIPEAGYYYGYDCYGEGCLAEPPPEQMPDPNCVADPEATGDVPTIFNGSGSATGTCDAGSVMVAPGFSNPVLNDWVYTSSGRTVFGVTVNVMVSLPGTSVPSVSVLLEYSDDGVAYIGLDSATYQVTNLNWTADGVAVTVTPTRLLKIEFLIPPAHATHNYYRLRPGPSGLVELYDPIWYEPAHSVTRQATATSEVSQSHADSLAYQAALALVNEQLERLCVPLYTATEEAEASCDWWEVGGKKVASASGVSLISQSAAETNAKRAAISAAQAALDCGGSNNDQGIIINDDPDTNGSTLATPYPSIQEVEFAGVPTKITCTINGFTHKWPSDVLVALRSPNGHYVMLMYRNLGSYWPASPLTYTFDDDAAFMLPHTGLENPATWASGTYKPSGTEAYNVWQMLALNLPCPACPPDELPTTQWKATFAELIATMAPGDAGGAWCLFVVDTRALYDGSIQSWEVTVT